jgi:Xaa-Pro aminopeptidase
MVGNKPTDVQQSAYDHIAAAHEKITPMFKPGVRGTEIFKATEAWIREHPAFKASGLQHHAGHGLGIRVTWTRTSTATARASCRRAT